MNNEPSLILARDDLRNNLVKRHNCRFNFRGKKLQRQICRSHGARHGHLHVFELFQAKHSWRNHHGAILLAHAAAAGHQRIPVLDVRIGVE